MNLKSTQKLMFFLCLLFFARESQGACDSAKMRQEHKLNPFTFVSYGRVLGQATAHPEKAGSPILLNAAIRKGSRNGQKLKRIHFYLQCKGCGNDGYSLWPDEFSRLAAKANAGNVEIWRSKKKLNSLGGEAFVTGKFEGAELKELVLHLDTKIPPNKALGEEKREVTISVPDLNPNESCGECCD